MEKLESHQTKMNQSEINSLRNNQISASKLNSTESKDSNAKLLAQKAQNKAFQIDEIPNRSKNEKLMGTNLNNENLKFPERENKQFIKKQDEINESLKSKNKREMTNEREENESRDLEQNDIFQSESVGMDLTIDSSAINHFDYNESVEGDN